MFGRDFPQEGAVLSFQTHRTNQAAAAAVLLLLFLCVCSGVRHEHFNCPEAKLQYGQVNPFVVNHGTSFQKHSV